MAKRKKTPKVPPLEPPLLRRAARLAVENWHAAVMQQYQRVRPEDFRKENMVPDVDLYVLALRNLLRAVTFARRVLRSEKIADALRTFNATVPNAIEIRNVIEHFDSFHLGRGHNQREGVPYVPLYGVASINLHGHQLPNRVAVFVGGYVIDLEDATEAATQLARVAWREAGGRGRSKYLAP